MIRYNIFNYFTLFILFGIIVSCGTYKTSNVTFSDLNQGNQLSIRKVNNFRSVGKIKNKDNRTLKDSLFYRSADLHELKDIAKINTLGIKKVIDLRTENEVSKKPDNIPSTIVYKNYPVFEDKEDQLNQARKLVLKGKVNINDANDRMLKFYQDYPSENPEMIQTIIAEILNADTPILYHCTAGKDRTGIITAIILKILKFDDEVIFQEYFLSNNLRKKIILKRLNTAKRLHFLFPKADLGVLDKLSWIEYNYLKTSFDEINSKYGSMDNYIHDVLGITEEHRNFYIKKFTY